METENRDVRQKLEPYKRHWKLIVLIVAVITAGTYVYYKHQKPTYTASAEVFVRAAGSGSTTVSGIDPETDPARALANEATLLQTKGVAETVKSQIHYPGDAAALLGTITVTPSQVSDFVTIAAKAGNPNTAARVANGFASAFTQLDQTQTKQYLEAEEATVSSQLAALPHTLSNQTARANLQSQLQSLQLSAAAPPNIQVTSAASAPTTAGATSSPARNALFAAVLGLVLAWVLIQAMEAFDRRLRDPVVEMEYGLPVLAAIPQTSQRALAPRADARLPVGVMEGARGLRTALDHGASLGDSPKTLLVTSAMSGEGKSTVVKSLALGYFESARRVLIIDADLRRPMVHQLFSATLAPGLSDVLRSAIPLSEAVQDYEPGGGLQPAFDPEINASGDAVAFLDPPRSGRGGSGRPPAGDGDRGPCLQVLTAGSGTSDPGALLGSEKFGALLAEAAEAYDVVLIDSPPILAVSDAIPVARMADAVVVVARSQFTTRDAAQRCRQALERVPSVTVLGVVANGVREDLEVGRQYYLSATS
ncbi:MAG: hypothetical protein JOZ07_08790 [Solirubrobacterales bacterium]|nr:hypothetical protein [Solirubrobacterales bacterium]